MKKVFFIIPTLVGGGAERVMTQILSCVDRTKFTPFLVLFHGKGPFMKDIPPDVKFHDLRKESYLCGFQGVAVLMKLAVLMKKERPDVAVSFMWYANAITLLAKLLFRINCKLIVSERNTCSISCAGRITKLVRKAALRFLYPKSDRILPNSMRMGQELEQGFSIQRDKIIPIHNPVDVERVNQCAQEEVEHPWFKEEIPIIIAIGKLTPQKGFSYLLRAFAAVVESGISCRLVMLGKGQANEKLQKLGRALNIDDRVAFLGFQSNPYTYLEHSTIFVLSSIYEGFPNVLVEALALGVPAIATRCPTGPEEIITDGVDGILVPPADEAALAEGIKKLLIDAALRKRLGEAGKKRARDFDVDKIVKQYEAVIETVCMER